MNKYRDIMGRINYGLFFMLVAMLPFPQLLLRYACVAWIVSWYLEFRWLTISNGKFKISNLKSALPFILFAVWYLWRIVSGLWSPDLAAWGTQMERYLAFGLMLPVGIWGLNEHYTWRPIGRTFVISCLCAIPFYSLLLALFFRHREIIDTVHWVAPWDYSQTTFYDFFVVNLSNIKHRLFLGSIELLGTYTAYRLYRNQWKKLLPILFVILSFIVLSFSRQILLSVVAVSVVVALFAVPAHLRKRTAWIVITAGVIIGAAVLLIHPRMHTFETQYITHVQTQENEDFARLNIWQIALEHPADYIAHGLGAGQSTPYLVERYQQWGLTEYAQQGFHCHSQYLEELMELGLPGLLFFLLMWAAIPLCAPQQKKQTAWVFVILFLCNMTTDCMFCLFDGVALWAIGLGTINQPNK